MRNPDGLLFNRHEEPSPEGTRPDITEGLEEAAGPLIERLLEQQRAARSGQGLDMERESELAEFERHPIHDAVTDLREELTRFIRSNTREQNRMGFVSAGADPADIKPVLDECRKALLVFDAVLTESPDGSDLRELGQSMNYYSLANVLQGSVESFYVYLRTSGYQKGVPEDALPGLLEHMIGFRTELGAYEVRLEALSRGLKTN